MAHLKLFWGERPPLPVYLIDAGVGRGQPNRRDDVLLIQFFLRSFARLQAGKGEFYQVPGAPALPVDGVFGPQTGAAITRFQKLTSDLESLAAYKIQPDGIVHADNQHRAPNSPLLTIRHINMTYDAAFGRDNFFNLTKDPLFPMEIRTKFYYP